MKRWYLDGVRLGVWVGGRGGWGGGVPGYGVVVCEGFDVSAFEVGGAGWTGDLVPALEIELRGY